MHSVNVTRITCKMLPLKVSHREQHIHSTSCGPYQLLLNRLCSVEDQKEIREEMPGVHWHTRSFMLSASVQSILV